MRSLVKNGVVVGRRGPGVIDLGHYILRLSTLGARPARNEGPPQGIFATEYADETTNFLCKCVLAWLIVHTVDSPYTTTQAAHLGAILINDAVGGPEHFENRGAMRHGLCTCPLCLRLVRYSELHDTVSFDDAVGLENAAEQVVGATRSTIVNLFHIEPLIYHSLIHIPRNVAWGHAVCNTRLGQRRCYSLVELAAMGRKVGFIHEEGIETFGWMSDDDQMIRSPNGAVWIQLNGDVAEGPPVPVQPPFDAAAIEADIRPEGEVTAGAVQPDQTGGNRE